MELSSQAAQPEPAPARDSRLAQRALRGYLTLANVDEAYQRIVNMLTGRGFSVQKWRPDAGAFPETFTGLRLNEDAYRGPVRLGRHDGYAGIGIDYLGAYPCVGLSTESATSADASKAAERREPSTWVDIIGGSDPRYTTREDRIAVRYTNENGVTLCWMIIPEHIDSRDAAQRDAKVLELAAVRLAPGRSAGPEAAAMLRELADTLRYEEEPLSTLTERTIS